MNLRTIVIYTVVFAVGGLIIALGREVVWAIHGWWTRPRKMWDDDPPRDKEEKRDG